MVNILSFLAGSKAGRMIAVSGIIFLAAVMWCGAREAHVRKPIVVEDTFGNNWVNWDAKDVFLALPEIVTGLTLRMRAEKLSLVNGDRTMGRIIFNGTKLGFRMIIKTEAKLVLYVTVVTEDSRENWRLVRTVNQWSITPLHDKPARKP